jgi:outer membrane protein assembly factor BamB
MASSPGNAISGKSIPASISIGATPARRSFIRDRLILLCYHKSSSYLLALDKLTGKELWKVDRGRDLKSYSTPLVIETAQGGELIVNSSENMEAFDPMTGKVPVEVR